MFLEQLQVMNFKNYGEITLQIPSNVNVLIGKNGSGKTNFLDAIYYLSITKSAFQASDAQLIRQGENYFFLKGLFSVEGTHHEITAGFQQGKKVFRDNGLDYQRLSEHVGKYPVVFMSPDDVSLIREGSEERRRFFDSMLSQIDKTYLEDLIQYNHGLKQRNSLLRMFFETGKVDIIALESYDQILIARGKPIFEKRKMLMEKFKPLFIRYFKMLVGGNEETQLHYSSGLDKMSMVEGLKSYQSQDLALQRTAFGIHRDDYHFTLDNGNLKQLGSQGQQKSFVIALKFAQWEIIKEAKGFNPLLLLDDIFDKLDDSRIQKLLELIKGVGQLFITDARPDRTRDLINSVNNQRISVFEVTKGRIEVAS